MLQRAGLRFNRLCLAPLLGTSINIKVTIQLCLRREDHSDRPAGRPQVSSGWSRGSMLSRIGAMFASNTGRRTPGKRNPIRCRVSLGGIRSAISSEIQKYPLFPHSQETACRISFRQRPCIQLVEGCTLSNSRSRGYLSIRCSLIDHTDALTRV